MEVRQLVAPDSATLRKHWQNLRMAQPDLRIRNAAEQLGVSELTLRLTQLPEQVRRLQPDFAQIYQALKTLGPVMTLARNDDVVHETSGRFSTLTVMSQGQSGLCMGEIDLRLFFSEWRHGYAITESSKLGDRYSLQFFDGAGGAIHKIYATERTDMSAWSALLQRFVAAQQRPPLALCPPVSLTRHRGWVDSEALRSDWQAITDVHQFQGVLKKHRLDRLTALEKIGIDWAFPVPGTSIPEVLAQVAAAGTPIMVFVGNRGVIQIFTGAVQRLVTIPGWFNVLDPTFNLHLANDRLSSCWVVRRPSADGVITSLEGFNRRGELAISLFGARQPGQAELPAWRALLDALAEVP